MRHSLRTRIRSRKHFERLWGMMLVAKLKRLSLGLGLIFLAMAVLLISDLDSRHRNRLAAQGERSAEGSGKVWRVRVLEFVNVVDCEEAERGVFEGLEAAGVVRGKDFEATVLNAQGDMATLNSLVDSAITDRADLIITLSTPTLQAALQRAGTTPIVHTFVSNPLIAGVGKSDTDHRPNVTGAYGSSDCVGMMQIIKRVMPQAKRIGAISTPGEVNAVYNYELLVKAATAAGYELETVGANGPTEVGDAAQAVCGKRVDLLCVPNSNLVGTCYPSIAKAARQARLPVFGFFGNLNKQGAVLALARDYHDMGRDGGELAARVIRGESPANIPLKQSTRSKLVINLDAAKSLGLTIPSDLIKAADDVVGAE